MASRPNAQLAPRQRANLQAMTLLFDADDTLWQNNIYFEQAIAGFISFLDHRTHSQRQVREHLNHCEHQTIAQYGYGTDSFRRSLVACFVSLAEVPLTPENHADVEAFAEIVARAEVQLLPGVAETLVALRPRHRLLLVTKGAPEEQMGKLERSGLQELFTAVEVLPEKNVGAYRRLIAQYALDPTHTWMIGNSPRSDVNPALAAGLNAVYIPHESTWVLEHEPLAEAPSEQTLLELPCFSDLLLHFESA